MRRRYPVQENSPFDTPAQLVVQFCGLHIGRISETHTKFLPFCVRGSCAHRSEKRLIPLIITVSQEPDTPVPGQIV